MRFLCFFLNPAASIPAQNRLRWQAHAFLCCCCWFFFSRKGEPEISLLNARICCWWQGSRFVQSETHLYILLNQADALHISMKCIFQRDIAEVRQSCEELQLRKLHRSVEWPETPMIRNKDGSMSSPDLQAVVFQCHHDVSIGASRRTRVRDRTTSRRSMRGYRHGTARGRRVGRLDRPSGGELVGGYHRPCRSERMKLWSNRDDRSAASCMQQGELDLEEGAVYPRRRRRRRLLSRGRTKPTSCKTDVAQPTVLGPDPGRRSCMHGRVWSLLCLWPRHPRLSILI